MIFYAMMCIVPFTKRNERYNFRGTTFHIPSSSAALVVLYSALHSALKAFKDSKNSELQQRRLLQLKMANSKSYFEWSIHAAKLDALDGTDQESRWNQETRLYDRRLLEEKVSHLRHVRKSGTGVEEQMFAVRADLLRNLGNITNSALHQHFPVVPGAIREYIEEVRLHLEQITHSHEVSLATRASFLRETRHAFGRTALILSGGGTTGTFHLGVVKALLEHKMLPRVLAGSSIGAVVCGIVATRTDDELSSLLDNIHACDLSFFSDVNSDALPSLFSPPRDASRRLEAPLKRLRHLLGDLTFLEAYTHTSRVLSVAVADADAADPSPRLLNYLTSPHVVVWSAVACSSSLLGRGRPVELLARDSFGKLVPFAACTSSAPSMMKGDVVSSSRSLPSIETEHQESLELSGTDHAGMKSPRSITRSHRQQRWVDGCVEGDLPLRVLSEMFSVNHCIVSQTDPRVVPLLNIKKHMGTVGQLAEAELKHRCRQFVELAPRWMPCGWLRKFSQAWEGDITIVPSDPALRIRTAVFGSTQDDLLAAIKHGEVSAWAKLSAIQSNCGVESTLDACIQQLSAWERRERTAREAAMLPLKSKLPSWTDFQQPLHGGVVGHGGRQHAPGCVNQDNDADDASVFEEERWEKTLQEHGAVMLVRKDNIGSNRREVARPPMSPRKGMQAYDRAVHKKGNDNAFAFECTDSTANIALDFSAGSTPRSVALANAVLGSISGRNSLDYIAP